MGARVKGEDYYASESHQFQNAKGILSGKGKKKPRCVDSLQGAKLQSVCHLVDFGGPYFRVTTRAVHRNVSRGQQGQSSKETPPPVPLSPSRGPAFPRDVSRARLPLTRARHCQGRSGVTAGPMGAPRAGDGRGSAQRKGPSGRGRRGLVQVRCAWSSGSGWI